MSELRTIKDLAPKMSDALQAMHDGLIEQDKREGFVVEMEIFGYALTPDICYGCAAACALQEMSGVNFSSDTIGACYKRAKAVRLDRCNLIGFESALDTARRGDMRSLCGVYSVEHKAWMENRIQLENNNWRLQLPELQEFINELKSKGL